MLPGGDNPFISLGLYRRGQPDRKLSVLDSEQKTGLERILEREKGGSPGCLPPPNFGSWQV